MLNSRTGRGGGVWQLGKSGVKRQGRHPSERPPLWSRKAKGKEGTRQGRQKAQGKEDRRHQARKAGGTRQEKAGSCLLFATL